MNFKKTTIIVVLFAGLFQPLKVKAQLSPDTSALVGALFENTSRDEPGGVLLISRHGKKIYRKAFGVTNLEQPTPVTGATIFVAASVSKQFTAAAILLLVQEGKLSLEDNVRKFIPELPDYGEVISIRQLLVHTSGLKDWRNVTYLTSWPTGYKVFNQEYAFRYICAQSNLNFKPGERYSYTNAGYDLAAIVIERITGKKFPVFVKERLLEPAGMTHSFFRNEVTQVIPNMASGYTTSWNKYIHPQVLDETYGAAGLLTTAEDLDKWNQYIFNSTAGKKLTALREQRYVLNNGDTISYANGGVHVNVVNGVKEITHSGLLGGFRALCTYYPEKGLSVTYMSNNKDISTVDLRKDIARIFFGAETPVDVKLSTNRPKAEKKKNSIPVPLAARTGVFLNTEDPSDLLKFHESDGKLMSYAAVLNPVQEDVFSYEKNIYRFIPGNDTILLTRDGETYTYARVESFNPGKGDLRKFTGNYYSPDVGVSLDFILADNRIIAYRPAGDSVILSPVFRLGNHFAFRGFDHGLRVTYFFKEQHNKVVNLTINLPRAAHIPFIKTEE